MKKVFYRDEGDGEVLIILPGNTSSSFWHNKDIDFYSNNFRLILRYFLNLKAENSQKSRFTIVLIKHKRTFV